MTTLDVDAAARFASESLAALSHPIDAAAMQAYMKTDMPFYGVKKPARQPILRELATRWIPKRPAEYRDFVTSLWSLPHREEKYLAIGVARSFKRFIGPPALPMYMAMVRQGAWWDFVDEIAASLCGQVLLDHKENVEPQARSWLDDDDMWVRRTALLAHLKHKGRTDSELLFASCSHLAHEKEFFIRKAIGWALREYAKTDPEAVRRFVVGQGDRLSGLSRREALKNL